jgi:hypothetical protein
MTSLILSALVTHNGSAEKKGTAERSHGLTFAAITLMS